MTRWLPYPLLSFSLLAMWLVLNQTLAPAHLLLGAALAFAGGKALALLQVPSLRVRRRAISIALIFWMVFVDIARSNIAVARIVLNPGIRGRTAGFIRMPLEVRHPGALAVLACIITATPGTVWGEFDSGKGLLVIHVLDLKSNEAWIDLIQNRYERLLLEIFE